MYVYLSGICSLPSRTLSKLRFLALDSHRPTSLFLYIPVFPYPTTQVGVIEGDRDDRNEEK